MTAGQAISGAELIEMVQKGVTRRTTVQEIATYIDTGSVIGAQVDGNTLNIAWISGAHDADITALTDAHNTDIASVSAAHDNDVLQIYSTINSVSAAHANDILQVNTQIASVSAASSNADLELNSTLNAHLICAGIHTPQDNSYTESVIGKFTGRWVKHTNVLPIASLPSEAAEFPVTVFNNRIWNYGGWDAFFVDGATSGDIYSSKDGITWTLEASGAQAPQGEIRQNALLSFDNKLWTFGGQLTNFSFPTGVYNSENGRDWNLVSNNFPGGRFFSYCVHRNKIFVAGGQAGGIDATKFLKTKDGVTWTEGDLPVYPTPGLNGGGLVDWKNRLWLIGGTDGNNDATDRVYVSDDEGGTWTLISTLPANRQYPYCIVYNGRLYVIGGTTNGSTGQTTVYYTDDGKTWSQHSNSLPTGMFNAGANSAVVFDGRIMLISGQFNDNVTLDSYHSFLVEASTVSAASVEADNQLRSYTNTQITSLSATSDYNDAVINARIDNITTEFDDDRITDGTNNNRALVRSSDNSFTVSAGGNLIVSAGIPGINIYGLGEENTVQMQDTFRWTDYGTVVGSVTNPGNAVDNNTSTYASMGGSNTQLRLTTNNSSGSGEIVSVQIRFMKNDFTGGQTSTCTPYFNGVDAGTAIDTTLDPDWGGPPTWGNYHDITDDTNAPGTGNWTWADVANLQLHFFHYNGGGAPLYLYETEVLVTYNETTPADLYTLKRFNSAGNESYHLNNKVSQSRVGGLSVLNTKGNKGHLFVHENIGKSTVLKSDNDIVLGTNINNRILVSAGYLEFNNLHSNPFGQVGSVALSAANSSDTALTVFHPTVDNDYGQGILNIGIPTARPQSSSQINIYGSALGNSTGPSIWFWPHYDNNLTYYQLRTSNNNFQLQHDGINSGIGWIYNSGTARLSTRRGFTITNQDDGMIYGKEPAVANDLVLISTNGLWLSAGTGVAGQQTTINMDNGIFDVSWYNADTGFTQIIDGNTSSLIIGNQTGTYARWDVGSGPQFYVQSGTDQWIKIDPSNNDIHFGSTGNSYVETSPVTNQVVLWENHGATQKMAGTYWDYGNKGLEFYDTDNQAQGYIYIGHETAIGGDLVLGSTNNNSIWVSASSGLVNLKAPGNTGLQLSLGQDGVSSSQIYLYGGASKTGSRLLVYNSSTEDSIVDYYHIGTALVSPRADLTLGPDIKTDSLRYEATSHTWRFLERKVSISDDLAGARADLFIGQEASVIDDLVISNTTNDIWISAGQSFLVNAGGNLVISAGAPGVNLYEYGGNSITAYGWNPNELGPEQSITYSYTSWTDGEGWNNHDNATDADEATYANSTSPGSYLILNGTPCDGTNLGTITKVEMRGLMTCVGFSVMNLQPRFGPGANDGTALNLSSGYNEYPTWMDWIDITDDTNAPGTGNWTWTDVQNLYLMFIVQSISAGDVRVNKAQIRITYAESGRYDKLMKLGPERGVQQYSGNSIVTRTRQGGLIVQNSNAVEGNVFVGKEPANANDLVVANTNNIWLSAGNTIYFGGTGGLDLSPASIFIGKDGANLNDLVIENTANDIHVSASVVNITNNASTTLNLGKSNGGVRGIFNVYGDGAKNGGQINIYTNQQVVNNYRLSSYTDDFNIGWNGENNLFFDNGEQTWQLWKGKLELNIGGTNPANLFIGQDGANLNDLVVASTNDIHLSAGEVHIPDGLSVGQDDTTQGIINVYGDAAETGGIIYLYNGADLDTYDYYVIRANGAFDIGYFDGEGITNLLSCDIDNQLFTISHNANIQGGTLNFISSSYMQIYRSGDNFIIENNRSGGLVQLIGNDSVYDRNIAIFDPQGTSYINSSLNVSAAGGSTTINVGGDDENRGILALYGGNSQSGGSLRIYMPADFDSDSEYFEIGAGYAGLFPYFTLGPNNDINALVYDVNSDYRRWIFGKDITTEQNIIISSPGELRWEDNIFISNDGAILNDLVVASTTNDIHVSANSGDIYLHTANTNQGVYIPGHVSIGSQTVDFGAAPAYGILLTAFESGSYSTGIWGVYGGVTNTSSGPTIQSTGLLFASDVGGTQFDEIQGANITANMSSENASGNLVLGVRATGAPTADYGQITDVIGLQGWANTGFGMVDYQATNYMAGNFRLFEYGTGEISVTNGYGILIETPGNGASTGVLQNLYGLYIQDQSTANSWVNKYNLYSAGANSTNVFEGRVIVEGSLSVSGGIDLPDNITGTATLTSGAISASIAFGVAQADTTYKIVTQLVNTVDNPPSVYSHVIYEKTTAGFKILFNGVLDSTNFELDWQLLR